MAATKIEGKFGLVSILDNRVRGMILVWDTPAEVLKFYKELRKMGTPAMVEKLEKLKPDAVPIDAIQ